MPDVPRVETVLIDRPNERALGAGEAAQGPTAAAIANAFAAATGTRIRELPLTPERVKVALASPYRHALGNGPVPTVRYPVDASADVVKPGQYGHGELAGLTGQTWQGSIYFHSHVIASLCHRL